MNAVTFLPEIVVTVFLAAVFVLVYLTVWKTLRDHASFGKSNTAVLAFCVSVLCVLGVAQFIAWPGHSSNDGPVAERPVDLLHWILIPFACLAISVLLAQLLTLTTTMMPDAKAKSSAKKGKARASTKTGKPRGRPRKQQPKGETPPNPAKPADTGPAPGTPAPASKQISPETS